MHIHGSSMNFASAVQSSAAGAERAAASGRAAETRRKLALSAQASATAASPDATLMIGQWTDARHSQTQSADQYRAIVSGKDMDFG